MELDREDGTERVLSLAVDVNENRAEGCKTHTLPAECVHRNTGLSSAPTSGLNRVTTEEPQINGFPEPDHVSELSLEPKGGRANPDSPGHIRRPDGETGCSGDINPDLTRNRTLAWTQPAALWGFPASPGVHEGTTGIRRPHGSPSTPGETSGARGTCSTWFKSSASHGSPTASGHTNTSDVWKFHADKFVIGESNDHRTTSAETSGARGTTVSWMVTGDAANAGEINGNLTAPTTINISNGADGDIWEFYASPSVTGETVTTWGTSGNQGISGEITGTPWTQVSPVALVGTSGTRESNAVAQETGSLGGTSAVPTISGASTSMTACEERTNTHLIVAGETFGGLTASGDSDGTRCTQVSSVGRGETSRTHESIISPRVSDEIVDFLETSDCLATSGEGAGNRRANSNPVIREEMLGTHDASPSPSVAVEMGDIGETNANLVAAGDPASSGRTGASPTGEEEMSGTCENNTNLSVAGKTVSIGGNWCNLSTSGETASTMRSSPGPAVTGLGGSLTTCGSLHTLDAEIAASVTGDPVSMKESVVSQGVAGPMDTLPLVDGVLPRDQVSRNPQLGNDATKAELAIRGSPVCQIRPRVCVGKCQSSCCTESEMKIPNGDVNCGVLKTDKIQREGTSLDEALEKGVRVGNCGYLVINRRSISGTSSIPVYSIREPRGNATERRLEVRSVSDLGPETISNLSKCSVANTNKEVSNQEIEGQPECDVDFSEGVGAARPRTLRTNPGQGVSLSCDSTPLNDENAGYFVDDGDMDVIMSNLELGRRQSAPDKLQDSERVHPGPSAEQTVNKRHGFADFLTRCGRKA